MKATKPQALAKRTILAESGTYRLIHRSAGVEAAGSCSRIQPRESWGAINSPDGFATSGRWFKTEAEARKLFDAWIAIREGGA